MRDTNKPSNGYAKHIVRKTQDEIHKNLEDYPPLGVSNRWVLNRLDL